MKNWFAIQWKEKQSFWGAVGVVLILLGAMLPLLMIAHYNFPCSDDFSYGGAIYRGLKAGKNFGQIFADVWNTAKNFYLGWQGRYFDDLVSAAGFGIAVPKYYFVGTYLVLISFAVSGLVFIRTLLVKVLKWKNNTSIIIAALVTTFQILYVPYADEAFFWYVGATGYTLTYALVQFLASALIVFYTDGASGRKGKAAAGICSALLVIMIGGSNYATALLCAELLVLAFVLMLLNKKRCLFLGMIIVEYGVCFALNALSPGNHNRMNNVDGLSPMASIAESLHRGLVFTKEWFHAPILLLIVVVILLSFRELAKSTYHFRMPVLFTVITFGVFSSIVTPALFASGTWGPGRLINVMYYVYYLCLLGNILYWLGFVIHRADRVRKFALGDFVGRFSRYGIIPMLCVMIVLFVGCLKYYGLQSANSTSAAVSLVKGEAEVYRTENLIRWELLEDDTVSAVELQDFSVKPRVLYHDDFSTDETDWRNTSAADFFGKTSVRLLEAGE